MTFDASGNRYRLNIDREQECDAEIERLTQMLERAWAALDADHAHTAETLEDQKRGTA